MSFIVSTNTNLYPYYYDSVIGQFTEVEPYTGASPIYYFGEDVVKQQYGGTTPWLTTSFSSGHTWWTPWYIPVEGPEYPTPTPPPPTPPVNPCLNISDYGIELRDTTFTFKAEAENFLAKPETDRVSSLDPYTSAIMVESKNFSTGRKYKQVCTNYYIDNLTCFVQHVSYDKLDGFDVYIAKYYFPNGIPNSVNGKIIIDSSVKSPDGYYYVTKNGQICYLVETVPTIPPIIFPPQPDIITPETPLVGAGSVYSSNIETFKDLEYITSTVWPDGTAKISNLWSHCDGTGGSTVDLTQLSTSFDVYQYAKNTTVKCNPKLFRICFGQWNGLGTVSDSPGRSMTKAIYSQYASKLLGNPKSKFVINGVEVDNILVINFNLDLYKTQLDPGNIKLNLSTIDSDALDPNDFQPADLGILPTTVSNAIVDTNFGQVQQSEILPSYVLLSGTSPVGILYPQHGTIILDAEIILDPFLSINDAYGFNAYKLFRIIITDDLYENYGFLARRREYKYIINSFARISNYSFNFSNNPTFITDLDGSILTFMKHNPKVYPTAIGLYNSKKELLAIGKFPAPMLKTFSEEAIVNIKISQ